MRTNETYYVIYFDNLGYYANHQPNYSWSFTIDINKAKLYKSYKNAEKQIIQAQMCSYKNKINWDKTLIKECDVEIIKNINIVKSSNKFKKIIKKT